MFMYSTAADGNVTLQLKEPDDLDRSSLAAMLARLQDDATFSISYQDADILSDGSIDVLLGSGTGSLQNSGKWMLFVFCRVQRIYLVWLLVISCAFSRELTNL